MIRTMRRLFKILSVLLVLTYLPAAWGELPRTVLQALKAGGIPPRAVGAVVQELGASRPTLAHEAQDSMNPASVMKLVTTYAGLELLGPAYRWKTEVFLDGNDVVLKGYGDPKLNYESFWMLLRNLRARGVGDIRGDLVLDRSYFGQVAEARIDDDTFRPYNVTPDALHRNILRRQYFVLQRVHTRSSLINPARESDRALQNRFELLFVLNARLRVFVLNNQEGLRRVEREQLARGQLMVEPINRAVLQVSQRVVFRRARQFVLAQHDLLLPRVELISRIV